MANKPTIAMARWADQIGANLVSPSSGERDLGFQGGTAASSGKVNWEIHELYNWALYLNDGVLSGDHTIYGALAVGGLAVTFASHTFTADSTTDLITVTAHGLVTGDGPFQVSNSGGLLPVPLAAATNYYVIVIGANTFKVAATRSAALFGVFFNITTNGTGTNSIVGVSATRVGNTTVTGALSAQLQQFVTAGYGAAAAGWILESGTGVFGVPITYTWNLTTTGRLTRPLDLPVGTVLSKLHIGYALGAATNSVTIRIGYRLLSTGAASEIALFADATGTSYEMAEITNFGSDDFGTMDSSAGSHVIVSNRSYWLALDFTRTAGTGTMQFFGAEVNPT